MKRRCVSKVAIVLMCLLCCGVSFDAFIHATPDVSAQHPSLTDDHYRMYRNFKYDSPIAVLELMGLEDVSSSPEEFGRLPAATQTRICSVITDYCAFDSTLFQAFEKALDKDVKKTLFRKLMLDWADVDEEALKKSMTSDEKDRLMKVMSSIAEERRARMDTLYGRAKFCLTNGLVESTAGPNQFLEGYNAVPIEFQLRDLYASHVPFIQWVREHVPPSEEKEELEVLVGSLKRKYLLDFW